MFDGLWPWLMAREIPLIVGLLTCLAWLAAEYLARRSTWNQGAPKRPSHAKDRGTYPVIALGIVASLSVDLGLFVAGIGTGLGLTGVVVGVIVSGTGLAIRGWALRTLGRFFTMPITIAADHRIVRDGPYRWLRHPAYTGGFLTALGIPLVLGCWPAFLFTIVACGAVYVHRIRIEEAALVERFGEDYREYSRGTSRLFPGIY